MLVDTGAWYAVADRSDRHHQKARRFYLSEAGRGRLLTTDLIVAETWTLISAHLGRPAALTFWSTLRATRVPILALDPVDLEAAWRIAEAFPDQTFSFTDCTSFAIMERLGVPDAFAFDRHFLVYRFGPRRDRAFQRWPR
jgi:predicted nucleic acid-binding protein